MKITSLVPIQTPRKMVKSKHIYPDRYPSYTIRTKTPAGTMFVTIMEENHKPTKIFIHIGKAGSELSAWAESVARLIDLYLGQGGDIFNVILELSNQSSNRFVLDGDNMSKQVHSGPDGLAFSIMKYLNEKKNETDGHKRKFGTRPGLTWRKNF